MGAREEVMGVVVVVTGADKEDKMTDEEVEEEDLGDKLIIFEGE
eukprot:CAMPEP_0114334382 /NCGR_PEP_ID=MMETSP0101-20121206/4339_1 /TAXON_ID=38822 ORGANISM="Pteridomonas danica, Strain PT" /NCGR_SAMPLE_ID=MMETSP0101 /ASSEMBLY_ACC=CAM_ASM_000211 /LENGTH=43 /DNA_ID= /DNA_START= /DNA_END= /DNA_ORIENTATION=